MTGFVLDCSIAVSWCFEDEARPDTDALLERLRDDGAVVPLLWHLELGNVLIQSERRGRLTAAETAVRLELIAALPIVTDEQFSSSTLREILILARADRLTTYDAAYLELSIRRGLPLATKDRALAVAARNRGVGTLPIVDVATG